MKPPHAPPRPLGLASALLTSALLLATTARLLDEPRPRSPLTVVLPGAIAADALAVDGPLGRVAVGDGLDGAVRLLDDRDGRLLSTLSPTASYRPQALAVDAPAQRLVVVGPGTDDRGYAWTVDTRTGMRRYSVSLGTAGTGEVSVGVDAQGASPVVVAGAGGDSATLATLLDAHGGRIVTRLRVGSAPLAVAVDGRHERAYVLGGGPYLDVGYPTGRGTLSLLDTRRQRLLRTVRVGGDPTALAVDEPAGLVVVANGGDGTVDVVGAQDGELRRTLRVGSHPVALAVDARRHRAFVLDATEDLVRVLDLRRGLALRAVRVPATPRAIATDAARGLVLVAADGPLDDRGRSLGPGVVAVLDAGRGAVVRTVPVGVAPRAIAVDAVHGRAIVVNSGGTLETRSGWVTAWTDLRRRLPWLPLIPAAAPARPLPASLSILDLQTMR